VSFELEAVLAFLTSMVTTGVVVVIARRAGALDEPDPARRIHKEPTPRLGGIGIVAGFSVGWLSWSNRHVHATGREELRPLDLAVAVGAALFFALGLFDDLRRSGRGMPAGVKWLAQVVAAAVPVALGLRWTGDANAPWPDLPMWGIAPVMTVLWILAVVNVVNFLDGIDLIVVATTTVVLAGAASLGSPDAVARHAIAIGAVLGFAVFNLPVRRWRAFMGDGGSHLMGFLIAVTPCWFLLEGDVLSGTARFAGGAGWPLIAAPLLPAILDVLEALIHKARVGVPLAQAHADHLYQRLVKAGWPAWAVAIRYGFLSLAGVVLAGPVAARWGIVAAIVPGVVLLVVHWVTGVRATRHVPRLQRT
jgi:UDP-GlcNAc:undecaprenyl-phosphate GlcNAc-1-phosphate transferase